MTIDFTTGAGPNGPEGGGHQLRNRPLRICFVALHFAPEIGGAERRTEKQARQLVALGHDVVVLTTRWKKEWRRTENLEGLHVVRVGGIYRRGGGLRIGRLGIWPINLRVFWTLWKWRNHLDVIHVAQMSPLAGMAALVGRYAGKAVVITIPSAGPSEEQRAHLLASGCKLMADTLADTFLLELEAAHWRHHLPGMSCLGGGALLSFIRRSNATLQALSTRSCAELVRQGFHPKQIAHITGSVDTDRFRPALRRPGPRQPDRLILCVARYDYAKGVDVLLHAWGRMMRASDGWRWELKPMLQLVGDEELRPQLEGIASALGIAESVEFLGERTDVLELFQQAWAFALPSRWEGMPNALLEAMACGIPCIATRVSGSEDIICDGVDGLLVTPECPVELAGALQRVIVDSRLAQRLGEMAREKVVREYQLAHVVEQQVMLYRRLLAEDADALHIATESRAVGK
jgi:glycosyltransferase involved in cell wall biosynthesis